MFCIAFIHSVMLVLSYFFVQCFWQFSDSLRPCLPPTPSLALYATPHGDVCRPSPVPSLVTRDLVHFHTGLASHRHWLLQHFCLASLLLKWQTITVSMHHIKIIHSDIVGAVFVSIFPNRNPIITDLTSLTEFPSISRNWAKSHGILKNVIIHYF